MMVLEFADGGNLRNYLKNKRSFSSLTWPDKFKMAMEITKGLKHMHNEQIIHRDLVKEVFSLIISNFI